MCFLATPFERATPVVGCGACFLGGGGGGCVGLRAGGGATDVMWEEDVQGRAGEGKLGRAEGQCSLSLLLPQVPILWDGNWATGILADLRITGLAGAVCVDETGEEGFGVEDSSSFADLLWGSGTFGASHCVWWVVMLK